MPNLDGWWFVLAPARWKHDVNAWWVVAGFALEEDARGYFDDTFGDESGRRVATYAECMEMGSDCEW